MDENNVESTTVVVCLDCDSPLSGMENPETGDVIVCGNCGVELEVINTDPVEIDYLMIEK